MRACVDTAGVRVRLETALPWVGELLEECCGDALSAVPGPDLAGEAGVLEVRVERNHAHFDTSTLHPLTRGAWAGRGQVVIRDVCTSGFDLRLVLADGPRLTYRWRPPLPTRAASLGLRSRFHLLVRAALLQYPAMWWASTRGMVPLHAPVCTARDVPVMLAGPGGVGKTTLLAAELELGGAATSDNLCVTDGRRCWGVVEPLRLETAEGRRMPHGRREAPLRSRASCLSPEMVVVLRRGFGATAEVRLCPAAAAARELAGGTYMAGELRRYWAFSATLSVATGLGPAHPRVSDIAEQMARQLPCLEVTLPAVPGPMLRDLVDSGERLTCA